MNRFDPRPDEPYGKCENCGLTLETEDDSRAHMQETYVSGLKSHRIAVKNPGRPSRVRSWVGGVISDAIDDAINNLRDEMSRGDVAAEEIGESLKWYSDFSDAWESRS